MGGSAVEEEDTDSSVTQLAGGLGLLDAQALTGRIEGSFVRRLEALSDDARRLLLVAAAEPVGDPLPLLRASERLGIAVAVVGADTDGLLAIGDHVTFRHPLVRSAVYRSMAVEGRRAVHQALAEATDSVTDPDCRAWHLAAAAHSNAGSDSRCAAASTPPMMTAVSPGRTSPANSAASANTRVPMTT